jgi:hypothetical protein
MDIYFMAIKYKSFGGIVYEIFKKRACSRKKSKTK